MAQPKAPCPLCGVPISQDCRYCVHCKQNLPLLSSGRAIFNGEMARERLKGNWYCTQCGTVANPRSYTKGSFGIEVLLWLMMILPGVLYTVWRLTSRSKGCPKCGGVMIPVTSPVAQAALKATPGAAA